MWPFRSKTQKKLDALQEVVNTRIVAVSAALEIFKRARDEFERLQQSFDEEECTAFILAQGQYGYLSNALLDEIHRAEDSIKLIRTAFESAGGIEPIQIASEFHELERRLAGTDETCRRLGVVCTRMVQATGLTTTGGTSL